MSGMYRYGFDANGMLIKKADGGLVHIDAYDALAQQLAASQAEVKRLAKAKDAYRDCARWWRQKGIEAQATITERDKQLAEAESILYGENALVNSAKWWELRNKFLAQHEGKEND